MKTTLYTAKTCPFCKMEKDYLTEKSVPFSEIYVDENPEEAKKMIEISGQMGVPFTVIEKDNGEKVPILGFDQAKIAAELGLGS